MFRLVLVEDEKDQADEIRTLLQDRLRVEHEIEVVETESDFIESMPGWIADPPDVFIIDGSLRWGNPRRGMPKPSKKALADGSTLAGLRCARLVRTDLPPSTGVAILTVLEPGRFAAEGDNVKVFRKTDPPFPLVRWVNDQTPGRGVASRPGRQATGVRKAPSTPS